MYFVIVSFNEVNLCCFYGVFINIMFCISISQKCRNASILMTWAILFDYFTQVSPFFMKLWFHPKICTVKPGRLFKFGKKINKKKT